jgi:hypothetical protein
MTCPRCNGTGYRVWRNESGESFSVRCERCWHQEASISQKAGAEPPEPVIVAPGALQSKERPERSRRKRKNTRTAAKVLLALIALGFVVWTVVVCTGLMHEINKH